MYLEFHLKNDFELPNKVTISSRSILGWLEHNDVDIKKKNEIGETFTIIHTLTGPIMVTDDYETVTNIIKGANAEFQNSMKVDDK